MHGLLDDLFPTLPMEGNNADTSEGEENTSLNTELVKNDGTKSNDLLKDVEQKVYVGAKFRTYVLSSSTDQETTNNSDWTNDDLTKVKGPEKEGSSSLQQESFKQVPNLNLSSVTNFMNMEVDDLSSIHDNMTSKNPSSASGDKSGVHDIPINISGVKSSSILQETNQLHVIHSTNQAQVVLILQFLLEKKVVLKCLEAF
ncbi:hypothetical protein Tco_0902815 [Tanacetum coccineum]